LIAVVDDQGALTTMDRHGDSVVKYAVPAVVFGFPAWSPDGSRIAVVGSSAADTSIYVFTVPRDGRGPAADPVVIYRSPDRAPFYLYWTPDGRKVTFLATEQAGLSLRIAPADGSAPIDGSGPDAVIRKGAPLYFDWESADRLLLHVGTGSDAVVGEVGPDGTAVAPTLSSGGEFRSASVSRDGRYLAYVRSGTGSASQIVVSSRDGADEHHLDVFGPAAFVFDPTGDTIASIAAVEPINDTLGFPLGPLRLMDARSGSARTLLDGSVVGFFWAPDGRTIAALRLVLPGGTSADSGAVVTVAATARPAASPSPPPGAEVHLVFIDVSTGVERSERVVRLASHFVGQLLPYFDQYALSHRLWSPDSTSILLPLVDTDGRSRLVAVSADGKDNQPVADGISGFWSP
jgi:TolB protein